MSEVSQARLPVPGVDVPQRLCSKCGEPMSIKARSDGKGKGWRWYCQPCMKAYDQQRRADPKRRQRKKIQAQEYHQRTYWNDDPEIRETYLERRREVARKQHAKNANNLEWKKRKAAAALRSHYKIRYGMTLEDVENLLEAQCGCAICGINDNWPGPLKSPVVDHCHETNQVRGMLCHTCNVALGLFKENSLLLQKAIEYLNGGNADLVSAVLHGTDEGIEHGGCSDASSAANT